MALAGIAFAPAPADSRAELRQMSSPRVLKVGPGEDYAKPSDAAASVRSGDTVEIAPGVYSDCAVWRPDRLTIEGQGVTIANKTCSDKGLFVVSGNNVVIRGITFRGAAVRDHNGAGIRAEGTNLTVENSKFIENETGILSNSVAGSTIIVRDSTFQGNGACSGLCAHGIYAGRIALLRVEHSRFIDQHHGHHIKSRAARTEIVDNDIQDGPTGNSSYLIDVPNGGTVVVSGNRLEKGPHSENRSAAIVIGEEAKKKGSNPSEGIHIENNSFISDLPGETVFVRNFSTAKVELIANRLQGKVNALQVASRR